MSDLVRNPEDSFSHHAAHMLLNFITSSVQAIIFCHFLVALNFSGFFVEEGHLTISETKINQEIGSDRKLPCNIKSATIGGHCHDSFSEALRAFSGRQPG